MEVYQEFDEAGAAAQEIFSGVDYMELYEENRNAQRLCHGDYNQHNILVTRSDMAVVRFDQMRMDLQIYDLYDVGVETI